MATFVLVHGAWHGGWCWRQVERLLCAAGHEVFTPTLTGLGERTHLANAGIDLSTHVRDVLGVLEYDDLSGVLLVGHGYGGMVITGVAERVPKLLDHLVYLDGMVPYSGNSVFDLLPIDLRRELEEQARAVGEGWRLPWPPLERWGITDPAEVQLITSKLVAQPIKTFQEPMTVGNIEAIGITRTFVCCCNPAVELFRRFAERARAEAWRYHELATGHDAMITEPRRLADLLLEACQPRRRL